LLRACQGPTGTTYPYGNTDEPGVCNDHRSEHPAVEYFGTSASWIYTMLESSCIDQIPETVDRTGSLAGCVTAEGAYDMMGNVHEWTADTAGTFRGGYFVDTVINGPGCLYATTAHDTAYWDYSTGFRCCAD
jgi:formylglycine-generating enzyme